MLFRSRDAGNSLVVVEHDPQVMLAADRILDIGPGPGERGGEIVFYGPAAQARDADTLTGAYLSGRKRADEGITRRPVTPNARWLEVRGAREHNLRGVTARLPLGRLVAITGVSGSGKSTLVQDVLYGACAKALGKSVESVGAHDAVLGIDLLEEIGRAHV